MRKLLKFKEWLADHVRGLQYPVPRRAAQGGPSFQLPSGMGFLLVLAQIWVWIVGATVIGAMCYVAYCFIWGALHPQI